MGELWALYNSDKGLAEQPPPAYLHPVWTACNTATLARWAATPCDKNVGGYDVGRRGMSCGIAKNHVTRLLADWHGSIKHLVVAQDVSFPILGATITSVDFALVAPIFMVLTLAWVALILRMVRILVDQAIAICGEEHRGVLGLVLPSYFVLFHPLRGKRFRGLMQSLSCLAAPLVVFSALATDVFDIFTAYPQLPSGPASIRDWISHFDTGAYWWRLGLREMMLLLLFLAVLLLATYVQKSAWEVRLALAHTVLQPGLRRACEHAVRAAAAAYMDENGQGRFDAATPIGCECDLEQDPAQAGLWAGLAQLLSMKARAKAWRLQYTIKFPSLLHDHFRVKLGVHPLEATAWPANGTATELRKVVLNASHDHFEELQQEVLEKIRVARAASA